MRKQDIKPGVVYTYKHRGPVVPIVFLSAYAWVGILRQDARGYGDLAFKRPVMAGTRKPQRGTVGNDGTIGYPAVIGSPEASEQELAMLQAFTLNDFDNAREPVTPDGPEFILVTSMARVVGEWEG